MKAAELQSLTDKLKRKIKAHEKLTDDEMTIASLLVHIGLMNKLMVSDAKGCINKLHHIMEVSGDVS